MFILFFVSIFETDWYIYNVTRYLQLMESICEWLALMLFAKQIFTWFHSFMKVLLSRWLLSGQLLQNSNISARDKSWRQLLDIQMEKNSYLTEKRSVLRIKISPKIFFSRKIRNIMPLIVAIQQPEDRAFQNISCRVFMLKNKYLALKVIVLCKYDRASIFTLKLYSSFQVTVQGEYDYKRKRIYQVNISEPQRYLLIFTSESEVNISFNKS